MKIGIIIAMDKEREALSRIIDADGRLAGNELILSKSGIGKVNAAIGAVKMISEHHPDCIISSGCAGGIDPSVGLCDAVAAAQTVYHDVSCGEPYEKGQIMGMPARFDADARLLSAAMSLKDEFRIHSGLICTGDVFLTAQNAAAAVKKNFPDGLAVDMESAAIAQVCHIYGVPFLSLRVISDTISSSDRESEYKDFWATVSGTSFSIVRRLLESLG